MSVQGLRAAKDAQDVVARKQEEFSRAIDARIEQMYKAHAGSCYEWKQFKEELAKCCESQEQLEAENALAVKNLKNWQEFFIEFQSASPMQARSASPLSIATMGLSSSLLAGLSARTPEITQGSTMPSSVGTTHQSISNTTPTSRPAPRSAQGLETPPSEPLSSGAQMMEDGPPNLESPRHKPRTQAWEWESPFMMSPQPNLWRQELEDDNILLVSLGPRSVATPLSARPQLGGTPRRSSTPRGLRTVGTAGTPTRHESPRLSTQMKAPALGPSPVIPHEGCGRTFEFQIRIADGSELGLDVSYQANDGALTVQAVKIGGAVESWNKHCFGGLAAGKAVLTGDTIVAINAATTPTDMIAEIRRTDMLRITVTRRMNRRFLDPTDELAMAAPWAQPRGVSGENRQSNRHMREFEAGVFAGVGAAAAYVAEAPEDLLDPFPHTTPPRSP